MIFVFHCGHSIHIIPDVFVFVYAHIIEFTFFFIGICYFRHHTFVVTLFIHNMIYYRFFTFATWTSNTIISTLVNSIQLSHRHYTTRSWREQNSRSIPYGLVCTTKLPVSFEIITSGKSFTTLITRIHCDVLLLLQWKLDMKWMKLTKLSYLYWEVWKRGYSFPQLLDEQISFWRLSFWHLSFWRPSFWHISST